MPDYNLAFNFPACCGEPLPGEFAKLAVEYWDLVFECLDPIWTKTFAATIYGKPDVQLWYNKMNSYTYLFGMFALLWQDLQRSAANNPCGQPDYETILAQYPLACMQEAFKCMGCKPSFSKRLFELFNIDFSGFTPVIDGIGVMHIEGGGPNCPSGPYFRPF